ncbi:MAG TPA: hypothetical protein PLE16_07855 [Spirochaetota bacterium]|nr:hypothetical protein [Spirochaetota bacterium]HPM34496.1 hypothetical protein [Spirochaetota bacterium]
MKDRGADILKSELKIIASDFVYIIRMIIPFFLIICYLVPVIAVFFSAFRSDNDFWLTGNVFRVISDRDYSHFFEGIKYFNSYIYGLLFSLSVSFVSFFLALKIRRHSLKSGRIWMFVFILSLLPAFFYLPIISAVKFSFSLFFFINIARYLFVSVLFLEKSHLPRDIIYVIILSFSFLEFSLLKTHTSSYFYSNNIPADFIMMPQKMYYSAALFPLAVILSAIILWALLRKPVQFLLKHCGFIVDVE